MSTAFLPILPYPIMISFFKSNLAIYYYGLLLFLTGGFSLAVASGYSLGFYFICFSGLLFWIAKREFIFEFKSLYLIFPMLLYGFGNLILSLAEDVDVKVIGDLFPFFISIFGYWVLRKFKPNASFWWVGIASGAIIGLLLSVYQSLYLGVRAEGFIHPIQFGNIALLFAVLCFVRIVCNFKITALNFFLFIGVLSGIVASILSQSRGGWIALPIIIGWVLIKAFEYWSVSARLIASITFILLLISPLLLPSSLVHSRISKAFTEFHEYVDLGKQDTSIGSRLAIWHVAFSEISNSPLLGHGNRGWIESRDAALSDGRLNTFSSKLTHLHNEFIDVVYKRGVIGLAFLCVLYIMPMIGFFNPYLIHKNSEVRTFAMSGIVVSLMYIDFGLTQVFLGHNSGRVVLCSSLICIGALMFNGLEKVELEVAHEIQK